MESDLMHCHTCENKRTVNGLPCPECQGMEPYCCAGERAQPTEPAAVADSETAASNPGGKKCKRRSRVAAKDVEMRHAAGEAVVPVIPSMPGFAWIYSAQNRGRVIGHWTQETSGVLRPAVEAYLAGGDMTDDQIAAMRAYLRQWIAAPYWRGAELLRLRIDGLTSRATIACWLDAAIKIGIDPL